jgi:hypothetical protein
MSASHPCHHYLLPTLTSRPCPQVVLSGFAILSAMCLLLVLADSLLAPAENTKGNGPTTSHTRSYSDGRPAMRRSSSSHSGRHAAAVKPQHAQREHVAVEVEPPRREAAQPRVVAPPPVHEHGQAHLLTSQQSQFSSDRNAAPAPYTGTRAPAAAAVPQTHRRIVDTNENVRQDQVVGYVVEESSGQRRY